MAVGRLGNSARKNGRAAITAAAVLLKEGEVVECIVGGQAQGANAVCLLTNKRLLLVSDREWKPDVLELPVDDAVTVQGWQDDRTASLVIQRNEVAAQVERIGDRPLAMELAQRIRARAAGTG